MATAVKAPVKPKDDLRYITPANIFKHKASDLFQAVAEDVKSVIAAGFKIDMNSWVNLKSSKKPTCNADCTVCLGGSVLMGFYEKPPSFTQLEIDEIIDNWDDDMESSYAVNDNRMIHIIGGKHHRNVENFMNMMDYFRHGDSEVVASKLEEKKKYDYVESVIIKAILEENCDESFHGQLNHAEIKRLISSLENTAEHLRKYNL